MRHVALLALTLTACLDDKEDEAPAPVGLAALGGGQHTRDSVNFDIVANEDDDLLDIPRDLAFNPDVPGELWVVNRKDDSVTIFQDMGTADQTSENRIDPFAMHFMEEVSSISFGAATWEGSDALTFGTCQESRNTYNDRYDANDFMGPTLWTADLEYFATSNEEAIEYLTDLFGFYTDLGSHLDMLHESPLCMGIAWETENVYWVFDGFNGDIVRYDFVEDHGIGYDDHSDGIISRVADLDVERVPDVPSHMDIDENTGLLYIADTGNNRILVLDPSTGDEGDRLSKVEPGTDHHELVGVTHGTLINGDTIDGMEMPSGLEIVDGTLLITDNATGYIFAFTLSGGTVGEQEVTLLDWIDTERPGGPMGIDAVSLDEIYFVDSLWEDVVRLSAK